MQERPERRNPERRNPERRNPERRNPERRNPERRDPERRDPERRDPERRNPERRNPERRSSERRSSERRDLERRDPERRDPERRDPERRDPERWDPEQEDRPRQEVRKRTSADEKRRILQERIEQARLARAKQIKKRLVALIIMAVIVLTTLVVLIVVSMRGTGKDSGNEAENETGKTGSSTVASDNGGVAVSENLIIATTEAPKVYDQFVTKDGKKYYHGSDGNPVKNTSVFDEDVLYQADAEGVLTVASGWTELDGKWYFADAQGKTVKNEYRDKDGVEVFLGEDGAEVISDFYMDGEKLFYATETGAKRTTPGWFSLNGKEYYADSDGSFFYYDHIKVDGNYYFLDVYGAKVDGLPYIDQYLGCRDMIGFMESHFNDYYFKTPYTGLWEHLYHPEELIRPYGEYGDEGGMNCTGFLSSLVYYTGGDMDKLAAMGMEGSYGDADSYLYLGLRGYIRYDKYDSVEQFLASGNARKGDFIYLMPSKKDFSYADCHVGVFWGDTPSENKLWSQTYANLCNITEITYKYDIGAVYVFPLARN